MDSAAEIKAKIDELLSDIQQLPALPSIANRVLSLAANPDVDIRALAEEISRDSSITASLIRLSNSAYFHPSGKIRSVHEAIMTLGLNTVKDILLIIASKGILKADLEAYKISGLELWDHSLLTAEMAARIAKLKKTRSGADLCFTAGLLHDTGKVVLVHFFKKAHRQISQDLENNPELRFSDLEKKYLGYSSAEIGGRLLQIWNFPDELSQAVLFREKPENAKINPELCCIVHTANAIVMSAGVGMDAGGLQEDLSSFALEKLKLSDDDLRGLMLALPDIMHELDELRAI